MQVDVRKAHVEQVERLTGLHRALVELLDRHAPHRARALERLEHRASHHPARGLRDRALGAGVLVGHEAHVPLDAVLHDPFEAGGLTPRVRIPGVPVAHGERVPRTREGRVRLGEVERAARVDVDEREGVVHHRSPALRLRDVVVREADGVPDLVRHVLPAARHRERLGGDVQPARTRGRQESRVDVVVHQRAPRVHAHHRAQDLTRARVGERGTHRGAGAGAVDPVDQVVARVHRIHARGELAHLERVPPSRALEDLVPPVAALEERRAVGLRDPRVEVVDDRRDGFRELAALVGGRVLRHQAPPVGVRRAIGAVDPLVEVEEGARPETGTRVRRARPEPARLREGHEGVVHLKRRRAGVRCGAAERATRRVDREGQHRVDLGVPREGPRARRVNEAPVRIHAAIPRLGASEALGDAVRVREEEPGRVDHEDAVRLGFDREGGHDRSRESLRRRPLTRLARAERAHAPVVPHQEHPLALALEPHHRAPAGLSAVEPARAASRGEHALVQEVLPEALGGEFQQHLVAVRVHADADEGTGGGRRRGLGADPGGGGPEGEGERGGRRQEVCGAGRAGHADSCQERRRICRSDARK